MMINLLAAALAGVAIPLILKRMAIDPALAGGVILTTVTDCCGFASFLGLSTLLLLMRLAALLLRERQRHLVAQVHRQHAIGRDAAARRRDRRREPRDIGRLRIALAFGPARRRTERLLDRVAIARPARADDVQRDPSDSLRSASAGPTVSSLIASTRSPLRRNNPGVDLAHARIDDREHVARRRPAPASRAPRATTPARPEYRARARCPARPTRRAGRR